MKKALFSILLVSVFAIAGCSSDSKIDYTFASTELEMKFEVPEYTKSCKETITAAAGEQYEDESFVPSGMTVDIICDDRDIVVEARSLNHNCYETCELKEYPTLEELQELDGKTFDYKDFNVFVDDSYWGTEGEQFYIGTYYPLNGEFYDTFRISMRLANVSFPEVDEEEYDEFIDQYLQDIADGDSTDEINRKVKDFKAMLKSIELKEAE